MKIIDFSGWQGPNVDGDKLLAEGVQAAYIRASHGKNKDACLDHNVAELTRVKIPFGVYHYASPGGGKTWQEQAEFFANLVAGELPPMLDIESNGSGASLIAKLSGDNGPRPMNAGAKEQKAFMAMATGGLDKQALDGWLQKWLAHFEKITGKRAGGYSAAWFMDNYLPDNDWVKQLDPFWVAHWTYDPAIAPISPKCRRADKFPPDLHQWSNKGVVAGVYVDLNEFRFGNRQGTVAEFESKFGVKVPGPVAPPPEPARFVVVTAKPWANLRRTPEIANNDIGDLNPGSNFIPTAHENGWYKIEGWIRDDTVKEK